jgi:hypothetical protein
MSIKFNVFQWHYEMLCRFQNDTFHSLEKFVSKIRTLSAVVIIYYTYSSVDNSPSSIMSGIVRKSMFSLGKLRLANVVKSELG